jgi:hypothetical protein
MSNLKNAPPVVDSGTGVDKIKIKEKVIVHEPEFRPLPEVDRNELHCIIEPVYRVNPNQNVMARQPINIGYNTN